MGLHLPVTLFLIGDMVVGKLLFEIIVFFRGV